jgi:uncharacterized protein YaiI (UPF0178 family)
MAILTINLPDRDKRFLKIYVDGDACPVVQETVEVAGERGLKVIIAHSRHHNLSTGHEHVEIHETGDRQDAADHFIFNNIDSGDVVVTDDLGLATLVLGRGVDVIRFRGDRPSQDDIEMRLSMREASRRERAKSNRVSGPPEFTDRDRRRFVEGLKNLLDKKL